MKKKLLVGILTVFLLSMGALAFNNSSSYDSAGTLKGAQTLAVIEINGFLGETGSAPMLEANTASAEKIMEAIRTARDRKDIKAVVLRINSPGGTSVAAQEVGVELDRLRKSGKPVVTSMGDVCASGGYWVACSSDQIVANPASLTGSIGVIMEFSNLQGLYEKLGIRQEVIKSGSYKDIGSSARPLTPEERKFLQEIVGDSYEQFLNQVEKGRKGKITRSELIKIADGRIFSGKMALKLGLVDKLGNYYDALDLARKMAGLKKDSTVEVLNANSFWNDLLSNVLAPSLLPHEGFVRMRY
ncbi:signal peptide peptidase SppA [Syntrophomonas palmitatica]|uniref:signal peptide peptidase SppA n=1 Tax=Syntrophomonas palmitatica TaxID=402877 RepID=UPI0006CFE302|nr:signal peptide peptidase SppA [Syntrophomonas palmitatica]